VASESPLIRTADPRANYLAYEAEIDEAIRSVLHQPDHILGPVVERFETKFANFVGLQHGVGVASGTDAIHLSLRGLGVGPDDEVITVSHTATATVAAIEMSGAVPILVDVELPWMTIDPAEVVAAIGPRTRAVVAVHLYGQPAQLTALRDVCDRHGLALIEDCAQAHGARWLDGSVGSLGDVACFSFYPTKNLGTVGDGGIVLTNDHVLADKVTMLRQYGWDRDRTSVFPGWNSRLGPLQAAILEVKLRHLPEMVRARRTVAERYTTALGNLPVELPAERDGGRHAYHLYVMRCRGMAERDALVEHLVGRGVAAGVHYRVPVHCQPAYRKRISSRGLKRTERVASEIVSLPTYPELTGWQQQTVISGVREFLSAE
jgi:dTDP-4-amino-4,6-dideoxygalactose transaminase